MKSEITIFMLIIYRQPSVSARSTAKVTLLLLFADMRKPLIKCPVKEDWEPTVGKTRNNLFELRAYILRNRVYPFSCSEGSIYSNARIFRRTFRTNIGGRVTPDHVIGTVDFGIFI